MEKSITKKTDAVNPLQIGATIEGTVVARDRSSLFIDLGIFGTGIIYGREFYAVKDVIKNLVEETLKIKETGEQMNAKLEESKTFTFIS